MRYVTYTSLSSYEATIFLKAGLDKDLNVARARLLGLKKTPFYSKPKNLTHYLAIDTKSEATRAKHLQYINDSIMYILELIGRYSNERFGPSAEQQHRFFSRSAETETFFLHLCTSQQLHKKKQILASSKEAAEYMPHTIYGDMPKELRRFEDSSVDYFVGKSVTYKESQLYAAGVFYMTSFLLEDACNQRGSSIRNTRFDELKEKFKDGILYGMIDQAKGGGNSGKTRSRDIENGYALFRESGIYEKYVNDDKSVFIESIIDPLKELLEENGITRSEETLRSRWAKNYVKRYSEEKQNT